MSMLDDLSWQVRGLFASEANRRLGFLARSLFQPSEMLARRRLARELAFEAPASLQVRESDGYLRFGGDAAIDTRDVAQAGAALAAGAVDGSGHSPGGKAFHRNHIASDEHIEVLLRLALQPQLIAIAATYLGVLPVIADLDFVLSLPSPRPWNKSQLWHCDDDAPRQLKLFVYCEDVGADDGPFEMVPAGDSERVRSAIHYRYAGRRYRVSDEVMDAHLARDRQLAIEGPGGSAFLVDTARCFHKGSRITAPDHRRIAGVVLYCTPNGAKLPLRLAHRKGPFAGLASSRASELERGVLGHPIT